LQAVVNTSCSQARCTTKKNNNDRKQQLCHCARFCHFSLRSGNSSKELHHPSFKSLHRNMLAVVHKQFKEEPRGVIMASYMCGLHQQSRQCAPPGHMARTMHKHLQASQPHMMDTRCIRSTKKINREEKLHDRHRKAFIQKFRSLYEVALEYSCKSSL
jgi:hypothetical protein